MDDEEKSYSTAIAPNELKMLPYFAPVTIIWMLMIPFLVAPIVALSTGLIGLIWLIVPEEGIVPATGAYLGIIFVSIGILLCRLFVSKIVLYDDRIEIRSIVGKRTVYKEHVMEIGPLSYEDAKRVARRFFVLHFNGRLHGTFLIKRMQRFDYVVSPSDPDEFLSKLIEFWGDDLIRKVE